MGRAGVWGVLLLTGLLSGGCAHTPTTPTDRGVSTHPAAVVEGVDPRRDATPAAAAKSGRTEPPLTFEQARGRARVSVWNDDLPRYRWAPDGQHVIVGRGEGRWLDPLTGARVDAGPGAQADAQEQPRRRAVQAALAREYEAADPALRRWMRSLSRAGGVAAVTAKRRLHLFRDGSLRRVGSGGEEGAQLNHDGSWLAFVRERNVVVVPTRGGAEIAVTTDGGPLRLNGRLDWVYQEEIYGRGTWDAMWWSPTQTALAFLRLDETSVPTFPVVDHRSFRVVADEMFYPKAGDPNPGVALAVWQEGRPLTVCDLSQYDGDILIVAVGWDPAGERVIFQVQDRAQRWLDLNSADPATGRVTRLLREQSQSWVNVLGDPHWLGDGSFLWLSERTGYKHIYHYSAAGRLLRAATAGDFAVKSLLRVDEQDTAQRTRLWFTANRESAVGNHLYRVDLDGAPIVAVTPGRGTHTVEINEAGTLILDRYSTLEEPPRARVMNADGAVIRELGAATRATTYALPRTTLHKVRARDGFELDVTLTLPADFTPERRYPIWLPTYSGPDSLNVRDRWRPDSWTQFLTEQGLVVLKVNNRSSSGRGQFAIAACYRQLGVSELADIEDAVRWVLRNEWADAERVGISGGSYGGFMAAYALTHSNLFALGVAWAGVYDWRCYDSIYTERFMDTPQNNPNGYDRTSVVQAAADLQGHLVMAHGSMDDNVHMQNAMMLAEALQRAGKDFELMIYPGARHGIRDREQRAHWNRLQWRAIQEHLLRPRVHAVEESLR